MFELMADAGWPYSLGRGGSRIPWAHLGWVQPMGILGWIVWALELQESPHLLQCGLLLMAPWSSNCVRADLPSVFAGIL